MAYTDPLTGVKSKHAYLEAMNRFDQRIADGEAGEFAVAVFDLNGLKHVNDTMGHEAGDEFILRGSKIICFRYKHSPVFRIGGDEFAVILEGTDYERRFALAAAFNDHMEKNVKIGDVVVAMGMSDYIPDQDRDFKTVFERADKQMYRRKRDLKGL